MKKRILIIACILLGIGIICWTILWALSDNTTLVVSSYRITDPRLPQGFHGFRIAQVADLHNTEFGENNRELLELIRENDPDIIVFTGDQIDSMRTKTDIVIRFVREAMKIAPCYMVKGNHEASIDNYQSFHTALEEEGVIILEDEAVTLSRQESTITLIGLDDPTLSARYPERGSSGVISDELARLCQETDGYRLLLSHHPEWLDIYAQYDIPLVLSGHAHGGQIRLKKYGGIIAPHQGFFPEYDAGEYHKGNTTLILSRGLGNSKFPFRINNPPELVMVELTN